MADFVELIKQCELAIGPDRKLDGLIFKATEWRDEDMWTTFGDDDVWHRRDPRDHVAFDPPPHYTGSIDAAVTLIPAGDWGGEISWNFGEFRLGGFVELNLANPEWMKPGYDWEQPPNAHDACVSSYDDTDDNPALTKPRPIAIAICIAALRAREALRAVVGSTREGNQ